MATKNLKPIRLLQSLAGVGLAATGVVLFLRLEPLVLTLSGAFWIPDGAVVGAAFVAGILVLGLGMGLLLRPLGRTALGYGGVALLLLAGLLYVNQGDKLDQDVKLIRQFAPGLVALEPSQIHALPVEIEPAKTTMLFFISENDCSTCIGEIKTWDRLLTQANDTEKEMVFFVRTRTEAEAHDLIADLNLQTRHQVIFDGRLQFARSVGIEMTPVLLIFQHDRLLFRHKVGGVFPQYERFVQSS